MELDGAGWSSAPVACTPSSAAEDGEVDANATELRGKTLKELKSMAAELGVPEEAVKAATDAASGLIARKEALVQLVREAEPDHDRANFELREELQAIHERGFGQLRERAKKSGWSDSEIDDLEDQADEADQDPGELLLEEIVKKEVAAKIAENARAKQLGQKETVAVCAKGSINPSPTDVTLHTVAYGNISLHLPEEGLCTLPMGSPTVSISLLPERLPRETAFRGLHGPIEGCDSGELNR